MAFLEGYVLGLGLVLLIGPVLFVLLQISLESGRGRGLAAAVGIFVSDVIAVLLCALGAGRWLQDPAVTPWLGIGGGILLVAYGLGALLKPPVAPSAAVDGYAHSLAGAFTRGFLVNFVNPFVFMVWLGILAGGSARYPAAWELGRFMAGCLLAILTLDSLKVLLAERIRPRLTARRLVWISRGAGVALLGFGGRLLIIAL